MNLMEATTLQANKQTNNQRLVSEENGRVCNAYGLYLASWLQGWLSIRILINICLCTLRI